LDLDGFQSFSHKSARLSGYTMEPLVNSQRTQWMTMAMFRHVSVP
jgi:hypothetical protein